jgi:type II secretory pathway pseudopilin PulG
MRLYQPVSRSVAAPAFTLVEVAVAAAIAALVMAGMFKGYTLAARRAQFSSFQMAATAMATQQMEQIVASTWFNSGNLVTNLFNPALTPTNNVQALCVPTSETNLVYATNYATVTQISTNPPYAMVTVSCVWNFLGMGTFTNTVSVLRAPDL